MSLATTTGPTTAVLETWIPMSPAVLGISVYVQVLIQAPGQNPLHLATSNALDLTVGNY